MHKTSKTTYEIEVERAYTTFNWSDLYFNKLGNFDGHKIKENKTIYKKFLKSFPNACPDFDYFKFMARCKVFYKDPLDAFMDSYICPICRNLPKKGITNSGRNGNYKGKTCKSLECHTELRKRTNLERGGSTCALQRDDVRPKVEASFQERWGVEYAGRSKEIRERIKTTNQENLGCDFPFQNPIVQGKVKETFLDHYGVENPLCTGSPLRERINKLLAKDEVVRKRRETMKLRGTIGNKSVEEEAIYEELLHYFPEVDRQYGDSRYNFKCDYYIPINDLFIEYQGYFCHGNRPYNKRDQYCIDLVGKWKFRSSKKYKKGKHKKFYSNAIKSYTILDVKKRRTAKRNNLNWLEFFNKDQMLDWLESMKPNSYYEEMPIRFSKKALRKEYIRIQKRKPKYEAVPHGNKIVLHFQSRLFFKQELRLWQDEDIREKLIQNRLKYIGKGWGEITAWELLRGMKISGIIKKPFSHFSQHWIRKFIEDYRVKSIYDPCGGWGHRLVALPLCYKYIYNDIRKPVVRNCEKIAEFLDMENKIFYNEDASKLVPVEKYDAVFTCPPYWNKEIYSKKGAENKDYEDFLKWWKRVVRKSCKNKPRLFAFIITQGLMKDMGGICKKEGMTLIGKHKLGRSKSHFNKGEINSEILLVFSTNKE